MGRRGAGTALRLGDRGGLRVLPGAAGCQAGAHGSAEEPGELGVFAAASLREVFTAIGQAFRQSKRPLAISFNFAGTQELRTQLEHGARVDVFAAADRQHMAALLGRGRVETPVVFAVNEPVVVVAEHLAHRLRTFDDLPNASRIVMGAPEVPIGRYALRLLDRAGPKFRARIESKVVSRELSVKQVLAKVRLGEADAGFVYRSDSRAAPRLPLLAIPPNINVVAEYPIAVVAGSMQPELARAFVGFVMSRPGREALIRAGFLVPSPGS